MSQARRGEWCLDRSQVDEAGAVAGVATPAVPLSLAVAVLALARTARVSRLRFCPSLRHLDHLPSSLAGGALTGPSTTDIQRLMVRVLLPK